MKSNRVLLALVAILSFCLGWAASVAFQTGPSRSPAPTPTRAEAAGDEDHVTGPGTVPPTVSNATAIDRPDKNQGPREKERSSLGDVIDLVLLQGDERSADPALRALNLRYWLDRLVLEDALDDAWDELSDPGSDLEGLVAAEFVGSHADPALVAKLEDLHRDADEEDRWLSAVALFVAGREGALRDWTVTITGTPPTDLQSAQTAVRRSGFVPSTYTRDVLVWAATSDNREVRSSVIKALRGWPKPLARAVASRLSNDEDDAIRQAASKLLGDE